MTDEEAIQHVLAGQDDAFRVLVERHGRSIFRLAYRMTRRVDEAEDVVQETLLRAYRQLGSFESRSSFVTWLRRIAVRCALDLIETKRRHNEQQDSEENPMLERVADERQHPERNAMAGEALEKLWGAMARLSPSERMAFILRHCDGMSIEEIGGVLGTKTNATKNTIFRAVRKLREDLEPLVRNTA